MNASKIISPISLLKVVWDLYQEWDYPKHMWFRGEPEDTETPLLPKLYRNISNNENYLLQEFRRKAPAFLQDKIPNTNDTDKWLFLAQHYGLPTRLLDWTESLFTALTFALEFEKPSIYVMDPIELNKLSATQDNDYEFPLTWFGNKNIGTENIKAAWEINRDGTKLPIAIKPAYSDIRQVLQSSCFTIFGGETNDLMNIDGFIKIKKIILPSKKTESYMKMYSFFNRIGNKTISQFGNLDSLTKDIAQEMETFGA